MSEVNAGTGIESSGSEPIVKTGSSADITSFDELESVVDAPKPSPRKAIENNGSGKSEPKGKAPKKEAPKKKEASASDEREEDGSEENDSQEEDNDNRSEKDSEQKEKSKELDKKGDGSKSSVKPKTFKVKSGDQEIELRSDTQFEVTIDGKKVPVSAQDLLNEFSGKTNWGKKYQELDTERKSFENNKKELESGINRFVELSKSDPLAAVEYACDISGMDSRKMIQEIRNQFKMAFEEYAKLSPEQRQERELQDERDYYKTKLARHEADRAKQSQMAELDKRVQATIQKHNLDRANYVARYEELKQLQAQGVFGGEITPELVGEYHQEMERGRLINEVINEFPDIENKDSAIKDLKAIWSQDPSLTIEQLKRIAVEVYGSDAARRLSKKVQKSRPVTATATPKTSKTREPLFFDDLE